MRKPEQTPEPSIEEILASIRRIIADDGAPVQPAETAPLPWAASSHAAEPRPSALDGPQLQTAARGERSGEDEILELTEDFMVAEEASVMQYDEPAEPAAMVYDDPYDTRFSAPAGPDLTRQPSSAPPPIPPAEPAPVAPFLTAGNGLRSVLSTVMSEVQRLAEGGSASPEPQASAPASPSEAVAQPRSEAPKPSPNPAPQPRPAARPMWSARHRDAESTGKVRDEAPAQRPESLPRKPSLANRDNWSQGVQMPVPEGGPAMPFPYGETAPARPGAAASAPPPFAPPSTATGAPFEADKPSGSPSGLEPGGSAGGIGLEAPFLTSVQSRAEKLAEAAVTDFASNRLSVPPVADMLKADKPLMEAITNSLADALSKTAAESRGFDDDAPLLEDLPEESFGPPQPVRPKSASAHGSQAAEPTPLGAPALGSAPHTHASPMMAGGKSGASAAMPASAPPASGTRFDPAPAASAAPTPAPGRARPGATGQPAPARATETAPELPPMPDIVNLDGGFVAAGPGKPRQASAKADPGLPELPHAEMDERFPARAGREQAVYRATDSVEPPFMPDPTPYPGSYGKTTLPSTSALGAPRAPDRFQAHPAGVRTLEDSVKEMLKPLLVQWLNENMPRIIKEALREEIAAKGLLPSLDDRG